MIWSPPWSRRTVGCAGFAAAAAVDAAGPWRCAGPAFGVMRCRRALAGRREVALDVTERAHGEGQRDQGDQSPDDPGDQRDAAGALDTQPPTRAPTGMADQAGTPAMLMTRPSRWWLGTICWHRLPVVNVEEDVQAGNGRSHPSVVQYQRVAASTIVSSPSTSRAPRAAANPMRSRPAGPYRFRMPQAGYAIADSG
jgi:hypothetical protein